MQQTQQPAVVAAFNALLANAQRMVGALVQKAITSGTFSQATRDFQASWNEVKGVVRAEIDGMVQDHTKDPKARFTPAGTTAEVFNTGLATDGKYGPKTAHALIMLLWARMGTVEAPGGVPAVLVNGAIPLDPRNWPTVYAVHRSLFDSLFLQIAVSNPPGPSPIPAPVQTTPPAPTPNLPGEQPVPSNDSITFDDGSDVVGRGQGKTSLAPMLALGAGALVVGGIVWYAVRKRKGR